MYSYILFDLDGTLTDPRVGITTCVQTALRKMGIYEKDRAHLLSFIGPPLIDEFMRRYGMTAEQARQAQDAYRERFSVIGWKENQMFDGVPALLAKLKQQGFKIAIASSKPTVFIDKILSHFQITDYFDVVSGATLDGKIATKQQVVAQALEQLGVLDRSQAVLVGDRFYDIEGAHAEKISCIAVTFGFGSIAEFEKYGADAIVTNMTELERMLLKDTL